VELLRDSSSFGHLTLARLQDAPEEQREESSMKLNLPEPEFTPKFIIGFLVFVLVVSLGLHLLAQML
jgi:hypothetical protein